MSQTFWRIIVVCLLLVRVGMVAAAPVDHFGVTAGRQAIAGGTVASSVDASDLLANPALLSTHGAHVNFATTIVFDKSQILLMSRPIGYEPLTYELRLSPRSDTVGDRQAFFQLSGQFELIPQRVSVGLALVLPARGVAQIQSQFFDESEQYFSNQLTFGRFGDRLTSEVFAAGIAYRYSDALSLGVSTLVVPQVTSVNHVYTPNALEPSSALINLDTQSGTALGVLVGLTYQPISLLRFGLAFRDQINSSVLGQNLIQINGAEAEGTFEQSFAILPDSLPMMVSGGIRLQSQSGGFVDLGTRYLVFSNLKDQHGNSMALRDVLETRLSAGLSIDGGDNEIRFGLGWLPSPTPDQVGRFNFVDNDRLLISTGSGHVFSIGQQRIRFGFAVQVHSLVARDTYKVRPEELAPCGQGVTFLCDESPNLAGLQTGNPGFPGFSHGGYFISMALDAQWYFDE